LTVSIIPEAKPLVAPKKPVQKATQKEGRKTDAQPEFIMALPAPDELKFVIQTPAKSEVVPEAVSRPKIVFGLNTGKKIAKKNL
jgi:hypothetical protein